MPLQVISETSKLQLFIGLKRIQVLEENHACEDINGSFKCLQKQNSKHKLIDHVVIYLSNKVQDFLQIMLSPFVILQKGSHTSCFLGWNKNIRKRIYTKILLSVRSLTIEITPPILSQADAVLVDRFCYEFLWAINSPHVHSKRWETNQLVAWDDIARF